MLNIRVRAGFTLAELLVVLLIGSLVLGLTVTLGIRQLRLYGDIGRRHSAAEQLRHATAILPVDLRAADGEAGDVVAGEARDSSIELRATIGTGVVCDADAHSLALVPARADSDLSSFVTAPQATDVAWVLSNTGDRWDSSAIGSVAGSVTRCALNLPNPFTSATGGKALVLDVGADVRSVAPGTPVRITRRVRYSIYKSSDGLWYLGYRDWNGGSMRLNQIQPVSGPFLGPATGPSAALRYFDSAGAEVASGASDTRRIRAVQITLRSTGTAMLGRATLGTTIRDSSVAIIALRNRR